MNDIDISIWPIMLACVLVSIPGYLVGIVILAIFLGRLRGHSVALSHSQRLRLLAESQAVALILTIPLSLAFLFFGGAVAEVLAIGWCVVRVRLKGAGRT